MAYNPLPLAAGVFGASPTVADNAAPIMAALAKAVGFTTLTFNIFGTYAVGTSYIPPALGSSGITIDGGTNTEITGPTGAAYSFLSPTGPVNIRDLHIAGFDLPISNLNTADTATDFFLQNVIFTGNTSKGIAIENPMTRGLVIGCSFYNSVTRAIQFGVNHAVDQSVYGRTNIFFNYFESITGDGTFQVISAVGYGDGVNIGFNHFYNGNGSGKELDEAYTKSRYGLIVGNFSYFPFSSTVTYPFNGKGTRRGFGEDYGYGFTGLANRAMFDPDNPGGSDNGIQAQTEFSSLIANKAEFIHNGVVGGGGGNSQKFRIDAFNQMLGSGGTGTNGSYFQTGVGGDGFLKLGDQYDTFETMFRATPGMPFTGITTIGLYGSNISGSGIFLNGSISGSSILGYRSVVDGVLAASTFGSMFTLNNVKDAVIFAPFLGGAAVDASLGIITPINTTNCSDVLSLYIPKPFATTTNTATTIWTYNGSQYDSISFDFDVVAKDAAIPPTWRWRWRVCASFYYDGTTWTQDGTTTTLLSQPSSGAPSMNGPIFATSGGHVSLRFQGPSTTNTIGFTSFNSWHKGPT